jgi:transcriptional regulator with GAF, ATPase, and Fis domain
VTTSDIADSGPLMEADAIAVDSERGTRPEAGLDQVRIERLVADLAARFVNIPPSEVDACIEDAQRQLVEALDLDRSTLFQVVNDDLVYTHSWSRPPFQVPAGTRDSAKTSFPWYLARLKEGEPVLVTNTDAVPSEADRDNLRRYGTRSNAVLPLMNDGRLVGALAFGAVRAQREWPPGVVERLRLVATVFAQALARRRGHEELQTALQEVQRLRDRLARDNDVLHREVRTLRELRPIASESAAAQRLLQQIDQVAPTSATVLLLGETGAGKEVFAQAIHDRSPRNRRPMVRVSCAAIPTTLIESELFGRERGAYTGAVSRQIGRFELAEGSTIFLDEIAELPLEAQVKLLRVVQDRVVERLGSAQPIKVDVRVIAATNRNLEEAVATRAFREDLYYRLNVFPITVPPLRERVADIPSLVWAFVDEFSKSFGKSVTSISRESMAALERHAWPGNVRELRNVIEHAMIVGNGPHLVIDPPVAKSLSQQKSLKIADVEAAHIRAVLDSIGWRVRGRGGAAELLGMKPTTLEGRMAKLGVRRTDKRG